MTTKNIFDQNEIAVFSDYTGQEIGKIEGIKGRFKANYFGMKITRWFTDLKEAVDWIETTALRRMAEAGKVELPDTRLLPTNQKTLFG